ncbi:MAG: transcriptional repressor, partial [Pseudomonadota bacterium]
RAVFEYNEGTHHDHFVCLQCGGIEEFIDPVIEERQHIIAKKIGFEITSHHHNIYGHCRQCQKAPG